VQVAGLMPPSWVFQDDGIIHILPRIVDFPMVPSILFLTGVSVGTVIVPALLVGAERDARALAERKLALQAHQLAEFLPAEAKDKVAVSIRGGGGPRTGRGVSERPDPAASSRGDPSSFPPPPR
jgi:hypothetical protein